MITAFVNQFVYRPDATQSQRDLTPADLGLYYETVAVTTKDGVTISGWYLPAHQPWLALLYCHGNAGDIRDWVYAALPFLPRGISVLAWDYRGFGASQGTPSEAGLYADGEAVWRWLADRALAEGIPAAVLGKSLGSAVAIHIAAVDHPAALVLDSAFTSMREVVVHVATGIPWAAPLRRLVPKLFESLERVPAITCPTLLIHGAEDDLVPVEHARRLYHALPAPKSLRIVPGAGHNDVSWTDEYDEWVMGFLESPSTAVD